MPIETNGFSLLELLIALIIVSVSLLGLTVMQLVAFHNVQSSYWASMAASQAVNMSERLQANSSNLENELTQWNSENQQWLPHGNGKIECQTNTCIITVMWNEQEQQHKFILSK